MRGDSFPPYGDIEYTYACRDCQAGRYQLTRRTLFTWIQNEMIAVQNFPIWECDLCGWREYDSRAISWLNTVLNPPRQEASRNGLAPLLGWDEPVGGRVRFGH